MKQWYKIQAKSNKTAQILIYETIGEDFWGDGVSAKRFVEDLNALTGIDVIDLHINSPGGNVFDGNAIYNTLRAYDATVNVFIDGIAASIASVIAMAGDTIEMPENSMLMIHDPSGFVMGTAEDMEKMSVALEKVKVGILAAYHNKSDLDNDEISKMMTAETWLTAQEAVDYGLADKVVEQVNFQAHIDPKSYAYFRNTPAHIKKAGPTGLKPKRKENNTMPDEPIHKQDELVITAEGIKKDFPGVAKQLSDEGREEGKKVGAEAECKRIKDVYGQSLPGHEDLVMSLMWDGSTTSEQAAIKVLAAEKAIRGQTIKDHEDDAPPVVTQVPPGDALANLDNLPIEERCKVEWDKSKDLQDEFLGDFDTYVAAEKAVEQGRVKIISKREE